MKRKLENDIELLDLPEEALNNVISYLDKKDLLNLNLVCSTFNNLIYNSTCVSNKLKVKVTKKQKFKKPRLDLNCPQTFFEVDLPRFPSFMDNFYSRVENSIKKIRVNFNSRGLKIKLSQMMKLLSNQNIIEVELFSLTMEAFINDVTVEENDEKFLKILNFSGSSEMFLKLFKNYQIVDLKIDLYDDIKNSEIANFIINQKNLTKLNLNNTKIFENDLTAMKSTITKVELKNPYYPSINQQKLKNIQRFLMSQRFSINSLKLGFNDGFTQVLPIVKNLKALNSITVSCIDVYEIPEFPENIQKIKFIENRINFNVEDFKLKNITEFVDCVDMKTNKDIHNGVKPQIVATVTKTHDDGEDWDKLYAENPKYFQYR